MPRRPYLFTCKFCKKDSMGTQTPIKKFCTKRCSELFMVEENQPRWNGGKQTDKSGYILIYSPKHPFNASRYVREHRLVMEKHIGRYLTKTEIVHHKNSIRNDNRIENLELTTSHYHAIHHHTKYTEQQLISKLKDIAKKLGRTPICRDVSNGIYVHRFGTWRKALNAAGLTILKPRH